MFKIKSENKMKRLERLRKIVLRDIKYYFPLLVFIEIIFSFSFFAFFLKMYLSLIEKLSEISVKSEMMLSNMDVESMTYQDLTELLSQQDLLVGLLQESYRIVAFLVIGCLLIYLLFSLISYLIILKKVKGYSKPLNFITFIKRFLGFNIIYLFFGGLFIYLYLRISVIISSFNIIVLNNILQIIFFAFLFIFLFLLYQGYRLIIENTILKTLKLQFLRQNLVFKITFINYFYSLISFLIALIIYLIIFYNGFFVLSLFYLALILLPLLVLIRINQIIISVKYTKKKNIK